ncbi:MAG: outer rane porin [Moraxellaceae bacterium]|jgi:predicted porin|nr:outer rane porin [Moraxellaceae bacterium]
MKRNLIALGIAAAVALPLTAQAAPKVYGKLNVAVEKYELDAGGPLTTADVDNVQVSSYASRFGVKGEDELTATLSAVYLVEWQVNGDVTGADLTARNRYVGLKHSGLGAIKLGAYDTNLKVAQGKVDLFNDTKGDLQSIISGETRASNVIGYESPKIADAVSLNLQLIPGEASGQPGTTPVTTSNNSYNGIADGISASVVYDKDDLYLAAAYDQEVAGNLVLTTSNLTTARRDSYRLVAAYKIADLTLGALYESSTGVNEPTISAAKDVEETAWLLSAAYKIGDTTLKAQYIAGENDVAVNAADATHYTLGVDYNFTSKTKAFGYYSAYENDTGLTPATNTSSVEWTALAVGIEHNF